MNTLLRRTAGFCLLLAAMIARLPAEVPDLTAPRAFTDSQGRSIVASVVSIDVKNVVLRRESDKKEFTFPIISLSPGDQVFLAENRAALGKATSAPGPTPLPSRKVTGTEVAKVKRFAVDVFMREKTGNQRVFRWEGRPKLTTYPSEGGMSAFGKTTYEELCAAAGMAGPAANGPEIVLCTGTMAEIQKLKQKLAPDVDRTQKWSWSYQWNDKTRAYLAHVFVATEEDDDPNDRRLVFRGLAAAFGCPGLSDEFPESAFDKKSKADHLGEIDRQLIRLLYQHVASRAGKDAIISAAEKNWAAMVAPVTGEGAGGAKQ
ncbi:MAG: hypothetical protein K0R17_3015 [Rariglobus sp.]|jgi:hypothetical protein|nr:hypothetical protein [Rariglobus sp.]